MLYDKNTNTCHFCFCRHARKSREVFQQIAREEAVAKSARMCPECNLLFKRAEEEHSMQYAESLGMEFYWQFDRIRIKSSLGEWLIVMGRGERMCLAHGNGYRCTQFDDDFIPGYHHQKCFSTTVNGFIDYIASHDTWRKANEIIPEYHGSGSKTDKMRYGIRKTLAILDSIKDDAYMAGALDTDYGKNIFAGGYGKRRDRFVKKESYRNRDGRHLSGKSRKAE